MNGSSQRILLWWCISFFLEEGRSGTAPYGKVNQEPRVTAAWMVPQWWGTARRYLSTADGAQGWELGLLTSPTWQAMSQGWGPSRGSGAQGDEATDRTGSQGYNMESSGVLLLKQFNFHFKYFKIWTIFLHACKISNNSGNSNHA